MRLLLLVLLFFSIHIQAQNSDSVIQKFVFDNLNTTLLKIPAGKENNFGFISREDFNQCTVGKPIRMIGIKDESLVKYNEWRVPILLNDNNKVLVTVVYKDGLYKIVDLGGAKLAIELQNISDVKQEQYLLRMYNIHSDFFINTDKLDNPNIVFIPLESAKLFLERISKNNKMCSLSFAEIIDLNNKPYK